MKKTAILASSNQHKLEEIQSMLKDFDYELKTMREVGLGDMEIIEDGDTFEANSLIKAKAVQKERGGITIADDSGLSVDCLNGAPGVFSARYAGEPCNDANNNKKLLEALKDVPEAQRTARFVTVITMLFENGEAIVVRGEVEGLILKQARGNNGFGYDPLFYVPSKDKTFAELTMAEKNELSHRGNALQKLRAILEA